MRTAVWCATLVCGAQLAGGLACSDGERAPALGSPRPVAGCESFSYEPCDILSGACQRELFGLMACLRGEPEVGEPPSVRLLAEADAVALVTSQSGGMADVMSGTDDVAAMPGMVGDERAFRAQVRGLELLGLIATGEVQDTSDVVDAMVSSAIAYYLVPTREIVIIDRDEPLSDLNANAVLAHELVHALQDRHHGLASLGADAPLDSDSSLAIDSLVEGEASLYQYLFTFAAQGAVIERLNWGAIFADLAGFGTELTLDAGSPILTAPSIFPYTHGTRFAGERWVRGGAAALDASYAELPRTTLEVLGGSGAITAWAEGPAPLDGYTLAGEDTAGAWITAAMLAGLPQVGAPPALAALASRWRGDRFWLFATADDPPAVAAAWAIDWEDAAAANEFGERAAALAPADALLLDTSGRSTRLCVVERAEELEAWRERLLEVAPLVP